MNEITITKKELVELNNSLGFLYTYSMPVDEELEKRLVEVYRKAQMVKGENKDFFMEQYQRLFSKRLPIQYSVGRNLDLLEDYVKAFNGVHERIKNDFSEKNEDGSRKEVEGVVQFGDKKDEADKAFEELLSETVKISVYPIKEEMVEKLDLHYGYLKPLIGKIIV